MSDGELVRRTFFDGSVRDDATMLAGRIEERRFAERGGRLGRGRVVRRRIRRGSSILLWWRSELGVGECRRRGEIEGSYIRHR